MAHFGDARVPRGASRPYLSLLRPPATFGKSTRRFSNVVASACRIPIVPAPHTPIPDRPTQASASAVAPHGASIAFVHPKSAPAPDDPSCPDAGEKRHGGCEDPIRDAAPFDLWELARSWTPGFCASGGRRTCAKKECALAEMVPALTLHGMWPSYSSPVDPLDDVAASPTCYWPQDCTRPSWLPADSPWSYDPELLPTGDEFRVLAPAWYTDGLGGHEWPKHGTCAAWADASGGARGLDQARYYASMFDLARREGTPDALENAAGGSIPTSRAPGRLRWTEARGVGVHPWVRVNAGGDVLRAGRGYRGRSCGTSRARGLSVRRGPRQPLR